MNTCPIALFGEAEKGEFNTAYFFQSLPQLAEHLGNPPPESLGLYYAIQALLHQYDLIYFRVKEEGYSSMDYFDGFSLLERQEEVPAIAAICLPGVGDRGIISAVTLVCHQFHSVLITNEQDLYDYLTSTV